MRLHLYIFRQILVTFGFAVGGMFFVAMPGIAVSAVHKLPNTGVTVLLGYVPLVLQSLAPYVLPISFLLAVVATYGRLAADREWTAIQMAGIRPALMLVPAAAVAMVLGYLTYQLVANKLPDLKRKEKEFVIEVTRTSITNLSPGVNQFQFGDFFLAAGMNDGEVLRDVYIFSPGDETEQDVRAFASSARIRMEGDVILADLSDAEFIDPAGGIVGRGEAVSVRYPLANMLKEESHSFRSPRYSKSHELAEAIRTGQFEPGTENRLRYEIHHRYAIAAAFGMFLLLGAATGLLMRRGTQLGAMAVSVGYSLLYYLMSMRIGKQLATSGLVAPELGAWATVGIGTLAGLLLCQKALRR